MSLHVLAYNVKRLMSRRPAPWPEVVARHRSAGLLSWALLHQMEAEVIDKLVSEEGESRQIVNMISAPKVLGYPIDDRKASFEGHDFMPVIFSAFRDAWDCVH